MNIPSKQIIVISYKGERPCIFILEVYNRIMDKEKKVKPTQQRNIIDNQISTVVQFYSRLFLFENVVNEKKNTRIGTFRNIFDDITVIMIKLYRY